MAAVITHVAFYAGWPKAWAAFRLAKEVYETETEWLDPVTDQECDELEG